MRPLLTSVLFVIPLIAAGPAAYADPAETVLYRFHGLAKSDGWSPRSTLLRDSSGNLFGTTEGGGLARGRDSDGEGTVFELSPTVPGSTSRTETILYRFGTRSLDGKFPFDRPTADAQGNLFLTTLGSVGYNSNHPSGTVIELSPSPAGQTAWTERVLHVFDSTTGDGAEPRGSILIDASGSLYMTTYLGGAFGHGAVVKLSPGPAGNYRETLICSFGAYPTDGTAPSATLTVGPDLTLITTTSTGGRLGWGAVVSLSPPASPGAAWTEKVVYDFKGSPDGFNPIAALTADAAGNFYTTTSQGGASPDQFSAGAVVQLRPPANGVGQWTESVIHSFGIGGDSSFPYAEVLVDKAGAVYTTASEGGPGNGGSVVKLVAPVAGGTDWTETLLYAFGAAPYDGYLPLGGLTLGPAGTLFTTTNFGGPINPESYDYGTVVAITNTGFATR